ncbi:MAG: right-handed parallel beta-helix repeat-containing protein [Phycisphaerales bacterium]|nr:right-handed parallel beta-helix repeat-containing protein [Phycisphaerales bacterium]
MLIPALAFVTGVEAQTYYVDGVAGNDSWSGLCAVHDGAGCGPNRSVSAAVAIAPSGAEVVIADGTYVTHGNGLGGRAITIRSASGDPNACILDADGEGRIFTISAAMTSPAVIRGLTLREAQVASQRRLVGMTSGRLVVEDCRLSNLDGGGIVQSAGELTVRRCIFSGNVGALPYGAGAAIDSSGGTLVVQATRFEKNAGAQSVLRASGNASAFIRDSLFENNQTTLNVIEGTGPLTISNCTIAFNPGLKAVRVLGGTVTLVNSVIWDNATRPLLIDTGSVLAASYSVIQGGAGGAASGGGVFSPGAVVLGDDPVFLFPGDARVGLDSPCIDAGTPTPPGGLSATALDNAPRVLDGDIDGTPRVDMGAFELDPNMPLLAAAPPYLSVSVPLGDAPVAVPIMVRNAGLGILDWQISPQCPFITADPPVGSAGPNELVAPMLVINPAGLARGVYSCTVRVSGGPPPQPDRELELTLYVTSVLRVPSVFPTIQAALNVALDGETILLADGVHTGVGNLTFTVNKPLTVRSESDDPERCVLDGQGGAAQIRLDPSAGGAVLLRGITLRNLRQGMTSSQPILAVGAQVRIEHCRVVNALEASHGAVGLGNGAVAEGCVIERAHSQYMETGAFAIGPGTQVRSCTVRGTGGLMDGIAIFGGAALIEDCVIEGGNFAGISTPYAGSALIDRTVIRGNGDIGVRADFSSLTLRDCTIVRNRRGGVAASNASGGPQIVNCTIADNGGPYGGVRNATSVTNSIVWNNGPVEISGTATVTNSVVRGGHAGAGNIDQDPRFALNGDYHLAPDSPARDLGTAAPPVPLSATDADGLPRVSPQGGLVDIGAHELQSGPVLALAPGQVTLARQVGGPESAIELVLRNVGGAPLIWEIEGCNWAQPASTSGVLAVGETGVVQVILDVPSLSHGAYSCGLVVGGTALHPPRRMEIRLNVTDELDVPGEHPTVQAALNAAVDGDIVRLSDGVHSGTGNRALTFGGRSVTLTSASGSPAACVLDGGGVAALLLLREFESVDVSGVTVRNALGRAVVMRNSGIPRFERCHFESNPGGAMLFATNHGYSSFNALESATVVDRCVFRNNGSAGLVGGAATCEWASRAIFRACVFEDNWATAGGALHTVLSAVAHAEDCLFHRNTAEHGGAILVDEGSVSFLSATNCTITQNTATGAGGGVALRGLAYCTIADSIIFDNSAPQGAELALIYGFRPLAEVNVSHSIVEGGMAGIYSEQPWPTIGFLEVLDADPLFAGPTDFRLSAGSPAIDAGNPFAARAAALDLDGRIRVWNARVDMGAYEFGSALRGDLNCDGAVNNFDVDPFVLALTDPNAFAVLYPECAIVAGDMDGDGALTNFDIDPFVARLVDGS